VLGEVDHLRGGAQFGRVGQGEVVGGDGADGAAVDEVADDVAGSDLALGGVGALQDLVEEVEEERLARLPRVGAVDTFPGFIGTELIALDDRSEYVVLTRFTDEASFTAWITSDNFTKGHRGESYANYKDNPFLKTHKLYEVLD